MAKKIREGNYNTDAGVSPEKVAAILAKLEAGEKIETEKTVPIGSGVEVHVVIERDKLESKAMRGDSLDEVLDKQSPVYQEMISTLENLYGGKYKSGSAATLYDEMGKLSRVVSEVTDAVGNMKTVFAEITGEDGHESINRTQEVDSVEYYGQQGAWKHHNPQEYAMYYNESERVKDILRDLVKNHGGYANDTFRARGIYEKMETLSYGKDFSAEALAEMVADAEAYAKSIESFSGDIDVVGIRKKLDDYEEFFKSIDESKLTKGKDKMNLNAGNRNIRWARESLEEIDHARGKAGIYDINEDLMSYLSKMEKSKERLKDAPRINKITDEQKALTENLQGWSTMLNGMNASLKKKTPKRLGKSIEQINTALSAVEQGDFDSAAKAFEGAKSTFGQMVAPTKADGTPSKSGLLNEQTTKVLVEALKQNENLDGVKDILEKSYRTDKDREDNKTEKNKKEKRQTEQTKKQTKAVKDDSDTRKEEVEVEKKKTVKEKAVTEKAETQPTVQPKKGRKRKTNVTEGQISFFDEVTEGAVSNEEQTAKEVEKANEEIVTAKKEQATNAKKAAKKSKKAEESKAEQETAAAEKAIADAKKEQATVAKETAKAASAEKASSKSEENDQKKIRDAKAKALKLFSKLDSDIEDDFDSVSFANKFGGMTKAIADVVDEKSYKVYAKNAQEMHDALLNGTYMGGGSPPIKIGAGGGDDGSPIKRMPIDNLIDLYRYLNQSGNGELEAEIKSMLVESEGKEHKIKVEWFKEDGKEALKRVAVDFQDIENGINQVTRQTFNFEKKMGKFDVFDEFGEETGKLEERWTGEMTLGVVDVSHRANTSNIEKDRERTTNLTNAFWDKMDAVARNPIMSRGDADTNDLIKKLNNVLGGKELIKKDGVFDRHNEAMQFSKEEFDAANDRLNELLQSISALNSGMNKKMETNSIASIDKYKGYLDRDLEIYKNRFKKYGIDIDSLGEDDDLGKLIKQARDDSEKYENITSPNELVSVYNDFDNTMRKIKSQLDITASEFQSTKGVDAVKRNAQATLDKIGLTKGSDVLPEVSALSNAVKDLGSETNDLPIAQQLDDVKAKTNAAKQALSSFNKDVQKLDKLDEQLTKIEKGYSERGSTPDSAIETIRTQIADARGIGGLADRRGAMAAIGDSMKALSQRSMVDFYGERADKVNKRIADLQESKYAGAIDSNMWGSLNAKIAAFQENLDSAEALRRLESIVTEAENVVKKASSDADKAADDAKKKTDKDISSLDKYESELDKIERGYSERGMGANSAIGGVRGEIERARAEADAEVRRGMMDAIGESISQITQQSEADFLSDRREKAYDRMAVVQNSDYANLVDWDRVDAAIDTLEGNIGSTEALKRFEAVISEAEGIVKNAASEADKASKDAAKEITKGDGALDKYEEELKKIEKGYSERGMEANASIETTRGEIEKARAATDADVRSGLIEAIGKSVAEIGQQSKADFLEDKREKVYDRIDALRDSEYASKVDWDKIESAMDVLDRNLDSKESLGRLDSVVKEAEKTVSEAASDAKKATAEADKIAAGERKAEAVQDRIAKLTESEYSDQVDWLKIEDAMNTLKQNIASTDALKNLESIVSEAEGIVKNAASEADKASKEAKSKADKDISALDKYSTELDRIEKGYSERGLEANANIGGVRGEIEKAKTEVDADVRQGMLSAIGESIAQITKQSQADFLGERRAKAYDRLAEVQNSEYFRLVDWDRIDAAINTLEGNLESTEALKRFEAVVSEAEKIVKDASDEAEKASKDADRSAKDYASQQEKLRGYNTRLDSIKSNFMVRGMNTPDEMRTVESLMSQYNGATDEATRNSLYNQIVSAMTALNQKITAINKDNTLVRGAENTNRRSEAAQRSARQLMGEMQRKVVMPDGSQISYQTLLRSNYNDVQNNLSALQNASGTNEIQSAIANLNASISEARKNINNLKNDTTDMGKARTGIEELEKGFSSIGDNSADVQNRIAQLKSLMSSWESSVDLGDKMKFGSQVKNEIASLQGVLKGKQQAFAVDQLYKRRDQLNAQANELMSPRLSTSADRSFIASTQSVKELANALNTMNTAHGPKEIEASMARVREAIAKAKSELSDFGTVQNAYEKVVADANFMRSGNAQAVQAAYAAFRNTPTEQTARTLNQELERTTQIMDQLKQNTAFEKLGQKITSVASKLKNFNKESKYGKPEEWTDAQKQQYDDAFEAILNAREALSRGDEGGAQAFTANAETQIQQLTESFNEAGEESDDFTEKISKVFQSFVGLASPVVLLRRAFGYLSQAASVVEQVDTAMVRLKRVTSETASTYNRFLSDSTSRAKELGTSISGLVSATAEFAKMGYTFTEAQGLAQTATVFGNLAGYGSMDEASSALIAVLNGFELGADQAERVSDRLTKVANTYAVNAQDLTTGLQKSASSLNVAGNDIDESIAMLTAISEVTRDASSAGSALKTMTMRIRGAKTELTDAGESTDGMAESTSKLREKVAALTNVTGNGGFDIMKDENTFKSTYDIMLGISQVWDQMSDINQSALLELIAGKVRSNQVAALLTNMSKAEEVLATSMGSANAMSAEQAKWLDSIAAKKTQMQAALQELATTALSSDSLKGYYDMLRTIIEGFNFILSKGGTIGTVLSTFGAALVAKNGGVSNILSSMFGTGSLSANFISTYNTALGQTGSIQQAVAQTSANLGRELTNLERAAIASSNGMITAQAGTTGLQVAMKALGSVAKTVGKTLLTFAVLQVVMAGIQAAAGAIDKFVNKLKYLKEDAEVKFDAFEDAQKEADSVSDQLDEIKKQIESIKPVTLADKEQLQTLMDQSAELEYQLQLKQMMEKSTALESYRANSAVIDELYHTPEVEESMLDIYLSLYRQMINTITNGATFGLVDEVIHTAASASALSWGDYYAQGNNPASAFAGLSWMNDLLKDIDEDSAIKYTEDFINGYYDAIDLVKIMTSIPAEDLAKEVGTSADQISNMVTVPDQISALIGTVYARIQTMINQMLLTAQSNPEIDILGDPDNQKLFKSQLMLGRAMNGNKYDYLAFKQLMNLGPYNKVSKELINLANSGELTRDAFNSIVEAYPALSTMLNALGLDIDSVIARFNDQAESAQTATEEALTSYETVRGKYTTAAGNRTSTKDFLSYTTALSEDDYKTLAAMGPDYADMVSYKYGTLSFDDEAFWSKYNEEMAETRIKAIEQLGKQETEYIKVSERLQKAIDEYNQANSERKAELDATIKTEADNLNGIQDEIDGYKRLISQIDSATSAYSRWKAAREGAQYGDGYEDMRTAYSDLESGYETGAVGSKTYRAAEEFIFGQQGVFGSSEKAREIAKRYLSPWDSEKDKEDTQENDPGKGLRNIQADMQAAGILKASGELNGDWTLDSISERMSEFLGTSISSEFVKYALMGMNDYIADASKQYNIEMLQEGSAGYQQYLDTKSKYDAALRAYSESGSIDDLLKLRQAGTDLQTAATTAGVETQDLGKDEQIATTTANTDATVQNTDAVNNLSTTLSNLLGSLLSGIAGGGALGIIGTILYKLLNGGGGLGNGFSIPGFGTGGGGGVPPITPGGGNGTPVTPTTPVTPPTGVGTPTPVTPPINIPTNLPDFNLDDILKNLNIPDIVNTIINTISNLFNGIGNGLPGGGTPGGGDGGGGGGNGSPVSEPGNKLNNQDFVDPNSEPAKIAGVADPKLAYSDFVDTATEPAKIAGVADPKLAYSDFVDTATEPAKIAGTADPKLANSDFVDTASEPAKIVGEADQSSLLNNSDFVNAQSESVKVNAEPEKKYDNQDFVNAESEPAKIIGAVAEPKLDQNQFVDQTTKATISGEASGTKIDPSAFVDTSKNAVITGEPSAKKINPADFVDTSAKAVIDGEAGATKISQSEFVDSTTKAVIEGEASETKINPNDFVDTSSAASIVGEAANKIDQNDFINFDATAQINGKPGVTANSIDQGEFVKDDPVLIEAQAIQSLTPEDFMVNQNTTIEILAAVGNLLTPEEFMTGLVVNLMAAVGNKLKPEDFFDSLEVKINGIPSGGSSAKTLFDTLLETFKNLQKNQTKSTNNKEEKSVDTSDVIEDIGLDFVDLFVTTVTGSPYLGFASKALTNGIMGLSGAEGLKDIKEPPINMIRTLLNQSFKKKENKEEDKKEENASSGHHFGDTTEEEQEVVLSPESLSDISSAVRAVERMTKVFEDNPEGLKNPVAFPNDKEIILNGLKAASEKQSGEKYVSIYQAGEEIGLTDENVKPIVQEIIPEINIETAEQAWQVLMDLLQDQTVFEYVIGVNTTQGEASFKRLKAKIESQTVTVNVETKQKNANNNTSTSNSGGAPTVAQPQPNSGATAASGTGEAISGTYLVDERGAELIEHVNRGTYELGTDNGARFTKLDKGDVVHTADETKKILRRGRTARNGTVKTGGARAASDAEAFGGGSSTVKAIEEGAKKVENAINTALQDIVSGGASMEKPKKDTTKNNNGGGGSSKSAAKEALEWAETLIDWIPKLLELAKKRTADLVKAAEAAAGYLSKNSLIDMALDNIHEEIDYSMQAYERYKKQAEEFGTRAGLTADIIELIKEGTIDINEYDEDTRSAISEYQKWWEKAEDCLDTLDELNDQLYQYSIQKLANIEEHFGNIDSFLDAQIDSFTSLIDIKNQYGREVVRSDFTESIFQTTQKLQNMEEEARVLSSEMAKLVSSGVLEVGSDDWYQYATSVSALNKAIADTKISLSELNDEMNNVTLGNIKTGKKYLEEIKNRLEGLQGLRDAQGVAQNVKTYRMLISNGMKEIQNLQKQNEQYKQQLVGLDVLSEKYQEIHDKLVENEETILQIKTDQEEWNDAIIDLKIAELEKQNEKYKQRLDIMNALDELEKARQRKVNTYIEGTGFVYMADPDELKDAQENMNDQIYELIKNQLETTKELSNIYDTMGNQLMAVQDTLSQIDFTRYYGSIYGNTDSSWLLSSLLNSINMQDIINQTGGAGEVNINLSGMTLNGVNSVNELGDAIITQLPSYLLQYLYSKDTVRI